MAFPAYAQIKLPYGLFGDAVVDLRASGFVGSIPWRTNGPPTPTDSTGQACAAANVFITTHTGTFIDGSIFFGQDINGIPTIWFGDSTNTVVTGVAGRNVGRIDPDPLGAIGGNLADEFVAVSLTNDNLLASPSITFLAWHQNKGTLRLPGGNYYFTSLIVGNGASIDIDTSGGPVNIFLVGGATLMSSSVINGSGDPADLRIFSSSSDTITVGNIGDFKGLIYAPYAKIDIKNSGDCIGAVWANDLLWRGSGRFFMSTDCLDMSRPETRDVDDDGMYDDWELAHWSSITTQTATADADVDGFSNRDEFFWDTNPKSSVSIPPRLMWNDAGNLELPWAATGRLFSVWSSTNLPDDSAWAVASNNISGTGTNLVITADTTSPNAAFRAGVSLP